MRKNSLSGLTTLLAALMMTNIATAEIQEPPAPNEEGTEPQTEEDTVKVSSWMKWSSRTFQKHLGKKAGPRM